MKKIVIGEGQEYEKTIYLNKPKGKKARKIMPKILQFMNRLQEAQEGGDDASLVGVIGLLDVFWSGNEFEDVIAPFVLQLDDPEGRKYLDEEITVGEMMAAFIESAQYLLEVSFGSAEVQEVMGKSEEEAQEAPKTRKKAR